MSPTPLVDRESRRRFLWMLAASPALSLVDLPPDWLRAIKALHAPNLSAQQLTGFVKEDTPPITAPGEAQDVFDFELLARQKLPPAHWGYLATGTDDDGTIRADREGFSRYQLRVRRLVDFSKLDTSVNLLGTKWETPILLCPVGSQKAFHPEGEIAVARAAKAKKHLQVLSNQTTSSVEDVIAARGEPVWYQLYRQQDWNQTRQIVKRAERAGCPALVFTVDLLGGSNRETLARSRRRDSRDCNTCHLNGNPLGDNRRHPMLAGLMPEAPAPEAGPATWEFVRRLKDTTTMKVFVKGIVTREDAELAFESGASGVVLSNHGGRAEASERSTIECVSEVVSGVAGRGPVIVDSGFRRGTDIFKALALGATAVGVGRPCIWGLAAFGQEGVEAVLDILRRELQMVMRQAGTTSRSAITGAYVVDRSGGR